MVSALARFRLCVELCDAHGLTRASIENIGMVGHCRTFLLEFEQGLADVETAHRLSVEIGYRYGAVFALESMVRSRSSAIAMPSDADHRARTRACRGARRTALPGGLLALAPSLAGAGTR